MRTPLLLLAACCSTPVWSMEPAPPRPVLEIGIAGGGAYVPDYPAAAESQLTGIALPYLIYRGKLLKADQDGVRGELALSKRWEFDLGIDAAFSADSDDNDERRGLRDLAYLLEAGPSLTYRIAAIGGKSLNAVAQLRAAFAVDTDRFDDVGFAFEPQLIYQDRNLLGSGLQLTSGLSVKIADQALNEYFYGVPASGVTADRAAYRAESGYQQTALSTGVYWPLTPRLSLFAANQLLFHRGSSNRDSPLFRNNFNYAIGVGLAYSLYLSERTTVDP